MKFLTVLVLIMICGISYGGNPDRELIPKELNAFRTEVPIVIDGLLNESSWQEAEIATHFTQSQPNPGSTPTFPTIVRVIYDDNAIYIGAYMKDPSPDSIAQEISERDDFGNTDWFGVLVDTYKSGINAHSFAVTPAGVQLDARVESDGDDDEEWDAVWESHTVITQDGWIAEIKIPYSALRFPKTENQTWYINFGREIRRFREESFWNPIDPQIDQMLIQSGILKGLSDISPPLRLNALPFIAVYGENYYDKNSSPRSAWGRSINGGMDVKLGINESFTLDMTLIPDFGQVQSDNQVLNLSPFEVEFDENRQFFTEGTEIFSKGDLFYSRRIGSRPLHRHEVGDKLKEGETIVDNPRESQLYNATKISGRTKKGMGIGIFNAIVGRSHATIRKSNGEEYAINTNPLTNYSVVAVDQLLKNNSFVSLINTNVYREGQDYEANVTGVVFGLNDRSNTYSFKGSGIISQKYFTVQDHFDKAYNLEIEKTSGTWQWNLEYNYEGPEYDIRDLGFQYNNNEKSLRARLSYNKYESFGPFNRLGISLYSRYQRLARPDAFNDFNIFLRSFVRTKTFWGLGLFLRWEPVQTYDYFEPRTTDFSLYYTYPKNFMIGSFVSSNFNKKLAFSFDITHRTFSETGRSSLEYEIEPRFRLNNKWSLFYSLENSVDKNDIGYVTSQEGNKVFGRRDRNTVINFVRTNYAFNNKSTVSFRLRHYWSQVEYNRYSFLQEDGSLITTNYEGNPNANFNAFTIDMVYRWRFAPGSDIYLVWKNSIFSEGDELSAGYLDNINGLLNHPMSNSFSLKCVYFLDYASLIKKRV